MLSENDLWVLSFYRSSEISGSLFFGRLAKSMKPGPIQHDMTKHYSDEALHAWHWTSCIENFNAKPLRLVEAYQDQYVAAAGAPTNMMEVLAITQVFEKRVINQYSRHRQAPGLHPLIDTTLQKIMLDEKWHIQWIREALERMEPDYGRELIQETLHRFTAADAEVYENTVREHKERIDCVIHAHTEREK